ncbi:MAG: Gfo/Idh/MocA family oxidoreductase [Spirochaetes bacterium]|nr:Gfo/Idh/MocA family oxidoreductase [Spirochaetota bacterium]
MTAKPVRIGIAGCGKIATSSQIPGFLKSPNARITALFDTDASRAEALRASKVPEARIFNDFEALIRSGEVDAVTLCTPNFLHHPMTLAALGAGLHVLCEKPMAATLREADEMVAASKRAGRVLQINQSCRYAPVYRRLADLVAQGEIGTVHHIRCMRSGGSSPDVGWSPGATWFVSKQAQGGVLLDIGIHMADIMRHIVGEVDRVSAIVDTRRPEIDVPDNVTALFRFQNGATGVLELSWTFPAGAGLLEIYGSAGTLRTGFAAAGIEVIKPGVPKPETRIDTPVDDGFSSYASFVAAIRGEAPSPTPGEYGRRALALCEAIALSSESRGFVAVDHAARAQAPRPA